MPFSVPSAAELLRAVLDMYLGGERNAGWSRPELEALRTRLETADTRQLAALEIAGGPFRRPLVEILGARRHSDHDQDRGRDLRTVVRALRCILDRAAFDPSLDARSMLVRYSVADLVRLVRTLSPPFEELAARRRVRFSVEAPEALVAEFDIEKLELLVLTLLFNAFKYTPEDGSIVLRIDEDAREGEAAIFIRDSGQTIAPHLARAIFDRSRQLDRSVFSNFRESGIGLGVSRDSAILHGGSLELLRRRETGAGFRLLLPSKAPSGIAVCTSGTFDPDLAVRVATLANEELDVEAALGAEPAVRDHRPLVLVVEDSRSLQRVLKQHLEPTYNTVCAFDAASGLALAKSLLPDLVIIDVELQNTSGESLITQLRATRPLNEVPILGLTEADDPARTLRLLADYVQDVVRKPFLLPEVRVRVKNLVASKQARDVLREHAGRNEADLVQLAEEVTRHQRALAERLEEVRVARELAESASRIKSNFLRMVSHELKTPVAAIQLHIRILERDPRLAGIAPLAEGFARIWGSTQRLLHLVETVIEWARVESGRCKLTVEQVDLGALTVEITRELGRYAEAKQISIRAAVAPNSDGFTLATDPRIARLLVLNLVLRGIQHTDSGIVDVFVDRTAEGSCRLRVHDNGLRVSPRDGFVLFEPLRSDNDVRWREGAGSGLGLYVIRDIARAIDGEVSLDNELLPNAERGNVIALVLPTLPEDRTTSRNSYMPHLASETTLASGGPNR